MPGLCAFLFLAPNVTKTISWKYNEKVKNIYSSMSQKYAIIKITFFITNNNFFMIPSEKTSNRHAEAQSSSIIVSHFSLASSRPCFQTRFVLPTGVPLLSPVGRVKHIGGVAWMESGWSHFLLKTWAELVCGSWKFFHLEFYKGRTSPLFCLHPQ